MILENGHNWNPFKGTSGTNAGAMAASAGTGTVTFYSAVPPQAKLIISLGLAAGMAWRKYGYHAGRSFVIDRKNTNFKIIQTE